MAERRMRLLPIEAVEVTAHIIGSFSAALAALQEYRRRRDAGERVAIYQGLDEPCLYVGPLPHAMAYEDQEAIQ